jgi:hypothetical protein
VNTNAAVVVLCYHRFEDRPKDALALRPDEFEKQLQTIKDEGFTVIKMQDFLAWRRGEMKIRIKAASSPSMMATAQATRSRGRS